MTKKSKIIHYGKLLKQAAFEQGVTNKKVMKILGIKSHKTLAARFDDGAFSYDQLILLDKKGLLTKGGENV